MDVWELVKRDMEARRQKGLECYGRPVDPGSVEDWLNHAYEECLDMAVYLRAEIERRKQEKPRG